MESDWGCKIVSSWPKENGLGVRTRYCLLGNQKLMEQLYSYQIKPNIGRQTLKREGKRHT